MKCVNCLVQIFHWWEIQFHQFIQQTRIFETNGTHCMYVNERERENVVHQDRCTVTLPFTYIRDHAHGFMGYLHSLLDCLADGS